MRHHHRRTAHGTGRCPGASKESRKPRRNLGVETMDGRVQEVVHATGKRDTESLHCKASAFKGNKGASGTKGALT